MALLAIMGHPTRGSEVIELLEMLGGINSHNLYGDESYAYYTIDSDKEIKGGIYVFGDEELSIFTLEQFEEKFPYKVGDKVKDARINDFIGRITNVRWDDNEEQIIYTVEWDDATTLPYFARNLQPYKEETMEEKLIPKIDFNEYSKDKYLLDLGNYDIKEEDGKTYAVRKQSKYPKTYEECCMVLQDACMTHKGGYKADLIQAFQKLLICRDAYWKIAGEEMELGKSWEPDWTTFESMPAIVRFRYNIVCDFIKDYQCLLIFPTAEMRDAFYENFKELIEECKELL